MRRSESSAMRLGVAECGISAPPPRLFSRPAPEIHRGHRAVMSWMLLPGAVVGWMFLGGCGPVYPACNTNADCRWEESCDSGRCRAGSGPEVGPTCSSSLDCPSGTVCQAGACRSPSSSGPAGRTCLDAYVCAGQCGDSSCSQACFSSLQGDERNRALDFDRCLSQFCRDVDGPIFPCIASFCADEDAGCFRTRFSCAEGYGCVGRCPDVTCASRCAYQIEIRQRVLYWDVLDCFDRNGCFDVPEDRYESCISSRCGDALARCGLL